MSGQTAADALVELSPGLLCCGDVEISIEVVRILLPFSIYNKIVKHLFECHVAYHN